MSNERGVINNKARGKQINSFAGLLRQRNITPTDIDGLIDYGGTHFLYLEGKLKGAPFLEGQRRALEAVVRSHWKAGHPSICILYQHETVAEEEIMVRDCVVRWIFCMKDDCFKWIELEEKTVIEMIEHFENRYNVF